jgi:hypothetical protein
VSKELSAVVADGLGGLLVHLLDVHLQPVLLRECRRADRAPGVDFTNQFQPYFTYKTYHMYKLSAFEELTIMQGTEIKYLILKKS